MRPDDLMTNTDRLIRALQYASREKYLTRDDVSEPWSYEKLGITSGQHQTSLGIMRQIRWAGRLETDILWS